MRHGEAAATNAERKTRMLERIRDAAEALERTGFVGKEAQARLVELLSELKAEECFVCRGLHATAHCPRVNHKQEEVFARAAEMVREDADNGKDEGTCVLGAGITVAGRRIIGSPFQGNVAGYNACRRAIGYLNDMGYRARWYDGVMD